MVCAVERLRAKLVEPVGDALRVEGRPPRSSRVELDPRPAAAAGRASVEGDARHRDALCARSEVDDVSEQRSRVDERHARRGRVDRHRNHG